MFDSRKFEGKKRGRDGEHNERKNEGKEKKRVEPNIFFLFVTLNQCYLL